MIKIPFKVSARTAKLIGQENFSNADGATIELVKNSYDADATQCLVIFDIPYPNTPETLTPTEYKRFSKNENFQQTWYKTQGDKYILSQKLKSAGLRAAQDFFFADNAIYIIDNGSGMDETTIKDQWMEIGTGNKELKYKSDESDRIKTGAKGIGRFALDRLGRFSEMYTEAKNGKEKTALYWRMNWRQFEQPHRALTEIEAELEPTKHRLVDFLQTEFQEHSRVLNLLKPRTFLNGTAIKITQLKDVWDEQFLAGAFKSLEALVPPKESGIKFELHFFHLQQPKAFGPVETAYFNDYDYKISGDFNATQLKLHLSIDRNELDLKKVKAEYPGIFQGAKKPYDLATITQREFTAIKTANELLKWEPDKKNKILLGRVGNFSFLFYFFKRQRASKEEYPYKDFNSGERIAVLNKWGGIKIYRDSFRVRPYGENGNDWLGLSERQAQSPAGAGQRIGQWRVGSNQIAGSIHISRVTNPEIVDKSDRGALVENEIFELFTKLVIGILNYFETDRTIILHPFYKENQWREEHERKAEIKKEAERMANELVKIKAPTRITRIGKSAPTANEVREEAKAYEKALNQSLQRLASEPEENAETATIRGLASLGLVMASFSHELLELKNNASEIDILDQRYTTLVPDDTKHNPKTHKDFDDGIKILRTLKADRQRMIYWIDYALTAIKQDKRKRQTIRFDQYFENLKERWEQPLIQRRILLYTEDNINKIYQFRGYEIDMDTIFHNLITNSIDAFNGLREKKQRKISIIAEAQGQMIRITYSDTGAGLASIFDNNREEIFRPFVTSKKDKKGNNLGTGLGMYLVKNIVEDYSGQIHLLKPATGFQLRIDLPIRKLKDDEKI